MDTQTLKVNKIAKTAYLTGGKIEAQTDEKLLANFGLGENGEPIKFKVKSAMRRRSSVSPVIRH